MITTTFADHHSWTRTLVACLIISLMVLSPLAPLASAAPKVSSPAANSAPEPAPVESAVADPQPLAAPFVPSITATKTDSFPDLDGDGKAAPGETITYDVNIANNGTDATGVNFADTIDANTTLVPGSLKVSPLAFPDVYGAAKNTPLVVGAPGVLANDTGLPAPTAVPIAGGATAQGGTVTLNADGSFTYNPAAGFEGGDSFTYTVTNGLTPNDSALVLINVDAAPSVVSTTPTNGATDQSVNTDITITFSEPVNVTGEWFEISCGTSGTRNVGATSVTPNGNSTIFTINPNSDFAISETCTVTVFAAQVTDQDLNDPPDQMASNFAFSFTTSAVAEAAPTVTTTTPTNGATQVAVNTNITINFSENVNILDATAFKLECPVATPIAFGVTPVAPGGTNSFIIDPTSNLPAGTICTVTVVASKVTDVDASDPPDNMAADFVFSFTTDTAPSVTTTTPTNGATQVAANTNITINFSENVNIQDATAFTVECPVATPIAFGVAPVAPGGTNSFILDPNSDLPFGTTCTVTVLASKVTDVDAGDPPDNMAANFVFSFTTDQPPSVTSTTPTNGATNQATNTDVTINFSEAVNVTGNWFQISCPTSGTRDTSNTVVTPNGGSTSFVINPNVNFAAGETCTVTVFAANVTDQDTGDPPDNMAANFVFSFTTLDAAPAVTTTTPTNGSTQVALNTNITINFSENVNILDSTAFTVQCPVATPIAFSVLPAAPGGTNSFTLDPTSDLPAGTLCTVTVVASKVTDVDAVDPPDNMAANFVFTFTTDTAPAVTTTTPTNGATQVATNTNITINFNENVNIQDATAFTVECPVATPISFTVTPVAPGGTNSFILDPTSDLPVGTICTVTVVASKVTDVDAGDPPDNMAANFVFSFTTDQAPSVTTTTPTNNATDVALNSTITINFSENVNVASGGVTIDCGGAVSFTPALPQNNLTSLVLTPTGGLPAGSNCTVTVDKTKISDTDAGDPPDNMVNDFVFSFKVKPDAVNDTYPGTLIGNVSINSAGVPYSITTNDVSANAFTITVVQGVNTVVTNTISATSANGGSIVMIVSGVDIGKFAYNPPAGFEGTDTFSYTISRTDGGGTDSATVSIPISGMIWFINNAASCPCDGRLSNPFNTLAAFNGVNNGTGNNPAANDNIFVFESATAYTGPVTLLNGQKFIGQDATATLSAITGLTPPGGSDPAFPSTPNPTGAIVNITSAGIGITVAQNNTLRGFTGGNATTDISGSGFGTLNISDVTLNGNGQTLSLTNGTLNATFGSLSSTNSATTGLSLTTVAGSLTSGSTTITNPTGIGISVNTSSATLNFAATSVTSSGGTGISLTTNTGAITFGALTITPDANQRGLLATDNTQTITIPSGTITTSGAAAVEISRASSTTPLAVALTSVSTTGGPNGIFLKNTSGSFTVNGDGTNTAVGGNATGGTISGMTGADGTTNGIGVYAENVQNLTLRRLTINGTNQGYGIRGNQVNNFTLEYSTVNGTNGTNVALAPPEGAGEGSVYFGNTTTTGMTGTGVITNCIISGGRSRNFSVINSSGTLNRLTVTGTTFGLNQNFVDAQRSFSVEGRPSAAGTILNTTVTGSTFTGSPGDVVNFTGQEPSITTSVAMDVIFQNNAVSNSHGFNNIGGFGLKLANFAGMTFNVSNNSFRDANGSTIVLQMATPVAGSTIATNLNGTINNNTIGVVGVADSGSKTGNGIFLSLGDNTTAPKGQATFAITNNTIRNWHGNFGISADNTGGNYNLNATITGNTVLNPSATSFSGLGMAAGAPSSADDIDVCAAITGNDFSASSPAGVNIDVLIGVSGSASSIRLPGYSGVNLNQVQNFIQGNQLNAASTTVSAFDDNGNGTTAPSFIGGAACTSPSAMALPLNSNGRDTFALKREIDRATPQTVSHHANIVKPAVVAPAVRSTAAPAPRSTESAVRTVSSPVVITRHTVNSTVITPKLNKSVSRQQASAQDKKRRMSVRPRVVPLGGETVTHSVGTLLAGKTVHIQFQVTVNTPFLGGTTVSNQGTVSGSNFSDVLTDDPAAGGANDPTTTPIVQTPNISVADAQANEPASGSAPMLFTVSLSAPAPAGGASVQYQTQDEAPALNHAVAGVDYTGVPPTTLTFAAGEQFKTVTVNILADGSAAEGDETFLLVLSNPTNALITDGQATGTIKQGNAAGTFLISEIRTSGPGGAGDDFVELYNNSDTPLTIAASDASSGYGLFKMGADCSATPVLIGVIPNGTVIPARGHFLMVGSAYSLGDYGGTGAAAGNLTLSSDIESDANVAIFNTSSVANLSSVTRLDAVGFGSNTGGNCDLLREGATLTPLSGSTLNYSYVRDECGKKGNPAMFGPCPTGPFPKDTNVNNDDFVFVDTSAAVTVAGQRLGAPGPQNLASPLFRNNSFAALLLDSNIGQPAPPNRVRDLTPQLPNAQNGTLSIRKRFVNNTGAEVTRLRFRIVDFSSISVPGGVADLRALTSGNITVTGITDAGTCAATGTPATAPCSVTVFGTTLEQPPTQSLGGAHNSTLSAGTITLVQPLQPGQSINLQFLLGVQQPGSFKFFFNIEALP